MFLHPIRTQRDARKRRISDFRHIQLSTESVEENKENEILPVSDALCLSWLMACFYSFYEIFWIFLGLKFINFHESSLIHNFLGDIFAVNALILTKGFIIFWIFIKLIFFPILTWLYVRFWSMVIRFFSQLFLTTDSDEHSEYYSNDFSRLLKSYRERSIQQVSSQLLSSNVFLIIPIIGKFFAHLVGIFYLYLGVRFNLGFTRAQSLIVILSPILLIGMMFFVWFLAILLGLGFL